MEDRARAGVVEDVADLAGVEPRVDGHDHAARLRDAEVAQQQRLRVDGQERDPIVLLEARRAQRVREAARARTPLCVGPAALAVHDRDPAHVHLARALQEVDRRQLLAVGQLLRGPGRRLLCHSHGFS